MGKFNKMGRAFAGVGAVSLAAMGSANAVVDTAAIVTAITEGQAAAIVVALAFGVAVWAIRGVKMIRRA